MGLEALRARYQEIPQNDNNVTIYTLPFTEYHAGDLAGHLALCFMSAECPALFP
jgi:hypothetical protein